MKIKNFIFLIFAGAINAFGITMFLAPVGLFDSGVSGTSMLISSISPLSLSICLLILNIPLFLFGLKKQGAHFTIYAVFTVAIYSLFAWVFMNLCGFDFRFGSPLAHKDLLLCAIFGGAISGLGSGLAIRFGGAMDGVEVMAVIFAKRIGITVGTFCLIYNVIVYIVAGILLNSWTIPLYSIVAYYVNLRVIDGVVDGIDRAKAAIIVTSKGDEISQALSSNFECGTTRLQASGGFSNEERTMIYFVVNRFQVTKMKNIVHDIDPLAYITLNEIADVFKANK